MTQPNECSDGALSSGGGGPTSAERVRSLLVAADSLTVTTGEHRCDLVGLHSVDAVGRLFLWAPAHSCLVTEVDTQVGGRVPAKIEVTDVAAVAVRDRVRARVAVHGSLSLNHPATCSDNGKLHMVELALDVHGAELDEAGTITVVDPVALAAAEVDPLATCEADMLLHIATAHPDAVEVLTRLVVPELLAGVVRVVPAGPRPVRHRPAPRAPGRAPGRPVAVLVPHQRRPARAARAQRAARPRSAAGAAVPGCGAPAAVPVGGSAPIRSSTFGRLITGRTVEARTTAGSGTWFRGSSWQRRGGMRKSAGGTGYSRPAGPEHPSAIGGDR